MPVGYYVRENKLTTPPSYSCQTTAEETLGYDEIAEFIHLLNPSITAAQAKTVLLPVTPENAHTWVLPYEYTAEAQCKDNAITTKLKELESNRFETAGIYGRRLVAIEEADKYGGAVSVLKAMTGQDPLRLERKNQQQEGSFIYEGQTLMMSNERLATTDYTSGIERRRMTVELTKRITKEERAEWSKRGGEETILHAEAAGIINWALQLSREEVTAVFKTMPERVRQANLDAALFNNPLMEWMLDTLLPDSGAAEQIGVKREFREYGAVLYEHSQDRLYPSYLTWCRENGRESVSLQRFSESLLDAAQTQRAQVRKGRASDGATKIFGLRFRADFETSWLELLKNSIVEDCSEDPLKTCMKDNPLILKNMKTMKDFSTHPIGENGYIPLPDETVEVEF